MSFSGSLSTKHASSNNESCMTRHTLIDLNPAGLKYYPLMISLAKCSGSFNVANELPTKLCVQQNR